MNILKLLFKSGIWNAPMLNKLDQENNKDVLLLHEELQDKLGYDVSDEVIRVVAVKRFLEVYTTDEILEVLHHFKQLK